jgi:hypothetical protein
MTHAAAVARFAISGEEDRSALRYPIRARVAFSWVDSRGNRREQSAWSRDLSARGVYVFSPVLPEIGSKLSLSIYFPPFSSYALPVEMRVAGQVVRINGSAGDAGESGFAVANERVQLCES